MWRVEERDEADLAVELVHPEPHDRGAVMGVRDGQLQLDAVAAGCELEQLLEVLVGERGEAGLCGSGHGGTVAGGGVTAPHPARVAGEWNSGMILRLATGRW